MATELVVELLQRAILLGFLLALPVIAAALATAAFSALGQGMTGIQDPALGTIPRMVVALVVLALVAPWIGAELAAFGEEAFALASEVSVERASPP